MRHNVLIVRPQDQGLETQNRLAAMGINGHILPLMNYVYYNETEKIIATLNQTEGVILTSSRGLYPFKTLAPSLFMNHICLVPGQSTAEKAGDCGFNNIITSPNGTASGMTDLIENKGWQDKRWLYSRGKTISFDMKSVLKDCLYEIITYDLQSYPVSSDLLKTLRHTDYDAIICYSRKIAEYFLNFIQDRDLSSFLKDVPVFCLSAKIAALFPRMTTVFYPPFPQEEALLQQLKNFLLSQHK